VERRVVFDQRLLPYLLLAPQLAITLVFFVWPASQAVWQSMLVQDAFGFSTRFVWFDNFARIFGNPEYLHSLRVTAVFSFSVALSGILIALVLAAMADFVARAAALYKTLLIWPYAVAPAIAGVLWLFMFSPAIGILAWLLGRIGIVWNHQLDGTQALPLVIVAATWKQISYNFLFFPAGMQAIPRSLVEAAAIDGAGPVRRFFTIVVPLLSPTSFFLLVVNLVYAFFDTFGIVHAITEGGPAQATTILVCKVYRDGFIGLDLGGSAAQSVVLMLIVIALTFVQFRYLERRVHYG
jgi:sn-glycerol 3-phosphate transport system permease protein